MRFVGLGAEGEAFLLADSALDFLRLVAVGHRELTCYELGLPPDGASVAAAPFRSWVEATFDVVALLGPPEWSAPRALRYVVDGRYLHLELGDDGIERLSLMLTAPRSSR